MSMKEVTAPSQYALETSDVSFLGRLFSRCHLTQQVHDLFFRFLQVRIDLLQ